MKVYQWVFILSNNKNRAAKQYLGGRAVKNVQAKKEWFVEQYKKCNAHQTINAEKVQWIGH